MMLRNTLCMAAAAVLCLGAAPAKPAAKAPAKPAAAKTAAPKPAAGRPAPRALTALDATDPATLVALLGSVDAQAKIDRREDDAVYLSVTAASGDFIAQFAGCNAQGKACQALLFDRASASAPSLAQVNGFNQSSMMCRAYQDKSGKAHVEYSTLVFAASSREQMLLQLNAWRGCLADFNEFSKDPVAFLAAAA